MFPAIPGTGIIRDEERIKILAEKFGNKIKKNRCLQYFCFYGKLGCGKTQLTREFCQQIYSEKRWPFFPCPKSEIVAFLNCSSVESLIDSLLIFCKHLKSNNSFDPYDRQILDVSQAELVELLFKTISASLKNQPGWLIVLDDINEFPNSDIQNIFQQYIFSDFFADQKGAFLLISDTSDSIVPNNDHSYKVHGLTIPAALKLFLMHADISPTLVSSNNSEINKTLQFLHTQPLSVISFALMVKNCLEKNKDQSLRAAIKTVEGLVFENVKEKIEKHNINFTPDSFELLYVETVLEMAVHHLEDHKPDKVELGLLSLLSVLAPFSPSPETLIAKFFTNMDIQGMAATIDDLHPPPNFHPRSPNQSMIANFRQTMEEGVATFNYALEHFSNLKNPDKLNTGIRINERISRCYKASPFINISQTEFQDFLSVHPLVHKQVRRAFFTDHYKMFGKSRQSDSSGYFDMVFSYFRSPKRRSISELWELSNMKLMASSSKILTTDQNYGSNDCSNSVEKIFFLDRLLNEFLNCLSHKDPVRFPDRKMLTHIRSRHLNYLLRELHDNFVKTVSCEKDKTYLTNELILTYLALSESFIGQNHPDLALPYLKILWPMVSPYYPLSQPLNSARLLILILKYNRISSLPITGVDDLDFACHALQKIGISCLDSEGSIDQLADDMMELYLLYGMELIRKNYLDYADHLINQAVKFNLEIFKDSMRGKSSPFDKRIFDLKLYLESMKGNIVLVRKMISNSPNFAS
ncbi:hypothetical protein MXB_1421 [Myxobolus squamalis]|nr:hypothetical protein MXB_1421 [Myxobolus squamalis]